MEDLRFEVAPRMTSLMVYDDPDATNYVASANVFICGDVGIIFTLNGSRFYEQFADQIKARALFESLGVTSLHGYVSDNHLRLIKASLRRSASVQTLWRGTMAGREMPWIRITLKG